MKSGSAAGSGHETMAVLLPGFAINWEQNQVTRQPQFRDLTQLNDRDVFDNLCLQRLNLLEKPSLSFSMRNFCNPAKHADHFSHVISQLLKPT